MTTGNTPEINYSNEQKNITPDVFQSNLCNNYHMYPAILERVLCDTMEEGLKSLDNLIERNKSYAFRQIL